MAYCQFSAATKQNKAAAGYLTATTSKLQMWKSCPHTWKLRLERNVLQGSVTENCCWSEK
jgi:hypothetical protein